MSLKSAQFCAFMKYSAETAKTEKEIGFIKVRSFFFLFEESNVPQASQRTCWNVANGKKKSGFVCTIQLCLNPVPAAEKHPRRQVENVSGFFPTWCWEATGGSILFPSEQKFVFHSLFTLICVVCCKFGCREMEELGIYSIKGKRVTTLGSVSAIFCLSAGFCLSFSTNTNNAAG